ncbi:B12-binding domain-containing radical SAM protein [Sesbania bispinosa]|nr:B12-binding domain-containing radical SAM protein [Sesbania bispinosa]
MMRITSLKTLLQRTKGRKSWALTWTPNLPRSGYGKDREKIPPGPDKNVDVTKAITSVQKETRLEPSPAVARQSLQQTKDPKLSNLTTWKDGTKTSLPVIRVANNRFTFVDADTSASVMESAMEVCVQGEIMPKKPPDPSEEANDDAPNSMDTFQDCEEGGSHEGGPG